MSAPEPRRCVAPVERIETEEHRRAVATERLSAEMADRNEDLPEPGPERYATVSAWLAEHPEIVVGGEALCGRDATEERPVEGLVLPLCDEHAAELDAERAS